MDRTGRYTREPCSSGSTVVFPDIRTIRPPVRRPTHVRVLVSRRWNDALVHHTWIVHTSAPRKFSGKTPGSRINENQTHTPRSQSRVLVSPLDDGLLGDYSVRRELLSDDVIRIDEIVRVACQRVDSRGESSQNEQQSPTSHAWFRERWY
jgi:hypothetical protein